MKPDDAPIESLRNLGPKSGMWLREAGITTVGELRRLGAVVAYQAVRQQREHVSLNLLWALAAGLEGIDWRELTQEAKALLRSELDTQ